MKRCKKSRVASGNIYIYTALQSNNESLGVPVNSKEPSGPDQANYLIAQVSETQQS